VQDLGFVLTVMNCLVPWTADRLW